jgi:glycosyltransferase involved in cell wall biosynthesis
MLENLETDRPTVLVAHWGKSGSGPTLSLEIAGALQDIGVPVVGSFNLAAETSKPLLLQHRYDVRTYVSRTGLIFGLPRMVLHAIRLRRFIQRHRVGLVISPMISIWQSLSLRWAIPKNVIYVAGIHDVTLHPGQDNHWLLRLCTRLEIARADTILTFSEDGARKMTTAHPGKRTIAMRHGVLGEIGTTGSRTIPNGRVVIGMFGRVREYKGVDVFAGSIRILKSAGFDVIGRVVGEGRIPSMSVDDFAAVDWELGWVEESRAYDIVKSFDILALPYQEASQSGVIAMSLPLGIPCVVTPVGGLVEQIQESGSGVIADFPDAKSFAGALALLLGDPKLYHALSENAIASATSTHTWSSAVSDAVDQGLLDRGLVNR